MSYTFLERYFDQEQHGAGSELILRNSQKSHIYHPILIVAILSFRVPKNLFTVKPCILYQGSNRMEAAQLTFE